VQLATDDHGSLPPTIVARLGNHAARPNAANAFSNRPELATRIAATGHGRMRLASSLVKLTAEGNSAADNAQRSSVALLAG